MVIGDCIGIHRSSVSRIVARVTTAIWRLRNQYIKFPRSREDMVTTMQQFHDIAGFPQIIGAVDGSLIAIKTPTHDEHVFVSRKGGHSLNILAVCNHDMMITYIVAKYGGATNDSFIWANCNLKVKCEKGDFGNAWLIGDSGFGLTRYLLTPVLNPTGEAEGRYNRAHKSSRQVIERCFGLAKHRFRCIYRSAGELMYEPRKCCDIIVACAVLYNICVRNNLFAIG